MTTRVALALVSLTLAAAVLTTTAVGNSAPALRTLRVH